MLPFVDQVKIEFIQFLVVKIQLKCTVLIPQLTKIMLFKGSMVFQTGLYKTMFSRVTAFVNIMSVLCHHSFLFHCIPKANKKLITTISLKIFSSFVSNLLCVVHGSTRIPLFRRWEMLHC